ncbi:hypothetical protein GTW29_16920 [Streptomyces sp. SID7834]|nr:hypothetical protein [Streptomyces sp. SID7834]MYT58380.1 hypothetical protein [Streptomyces sp. SID7834]
MGLRRTMPMKTERTDLSAHETTYQASRGGFFPAPNKPVPGTPDTNKGKGGRS